MWWSICSENTQKTNLRQFFLQCYGLRDSDFDGTGLHQGDLLEMFKENNLAKVSFLKLLRKTTSDLFINLQLNDFQNRSDQIRQQVE